jgi:predicted transcriptional regulator
MTEVIQEQPEDASCAEILRALAFQNMVDRGLADSREGRVISNEEMGHRMEEWRN